MVVSPLQVELWAPAYNLVVGTTLKDAFPIEKMIDFQPAFCFVQTSNKPQLSSYKTIYKVYNPTY